MSTRARRWIVILVAAGIPVVILLTATRSFVTPTKLDPTFPPKCDAIYRQASTDDVSGAATAAAAVVQATDATLEEQICAKSALVELTKLNVAGAGAELDLSKRDRCAVAESFERHQARPAALSVYQLLRGSGTPAEKVCATRGTTRLAAARTATLTHCAVVARLYVLGPAKDAVAAMKAALSDDATTTADVVCLANVASAARDLDTATVVAPDPSTLKPILPQACLDAANYARAGHVDSARNKYKRQLRESANPEEQACAVGGLARLSPEDTFADWSFAQANRVTEWITGWVPGGPLVFAEGSKNVVVAVFWFLLAGLLIVAIRQFIRWRRERWPGPVQIGAVQGASAAAGSNAAATASGDNDVDVAEVIRSHLSRAGVYEHQYTGGVGELLIDVSAALGSVGDTGMFGKLVNSIRGAVSITAGYVMTVHQDHDPNASDGEYRLIVQLDAAETGDTFAVDEYGAASYRDAAVLAAYGSYLKLVDRDEVRRRTPSFLRWTSREGLAEYHAALVDIRCESFRRAVEHLDEAARYEPANLQVQLELTNANIALAEGTPNSNVLRMATDAGALYLSALKAGLCAVILNGYSEEAHSRLALAMGYVGQWRTSWSDSPEKDEITRLLGEVGDLPHPANVLDEPAGEAFQRHFLARADHHWRLAARRTWWPVIAWVALWPNRRRTVSGSVWPFRRDRKSIHDLVLAADVGTRYDRFAFETPSATEKALVAFHLFRVRFGRMLWLRRSPGKESDVQYNLAAAYARRAVFVNDEPLPVLNADAQQQQARALECLKRSFEGAGRELKDGDVDFIETDPDFKELRVSDRYKRWVARFGNVDELEVAKKQWVAQFSTLAASADAASRWWYDHLEQAIPRSRAWNDKFATWASGVITWVGDDLERWTALGAWLDRPASVVAKGAFVGSIKQPPINSSRQFTALAPPTLPGDSAATRDDVITSNFEAFQSFRPYVSTATAIVRNDLLVALDVMSARDATAFEDQFRRVARTHAGAWSLAAAFAQDPIELVALLELVGQLGV